MQLYSDTEPTRHRVGEPVYIQQMHTQTNLLTEQWFTKLLYTVSPVSLYPTS